MSLSLALAIAAAGPFADLDAIDRQVAQFTGVAVGQPGGAGAPVDRRLRLQPCGRGLSLAWRGPSRDAVVVQCPDTGSWKLFVPVAGGGSTGPAAMPAVTRGDAVTIAVNGDGFTVSQPGEAMEGGAVGAWIKVRGVSANQRPGAADVMRAQVIRPGLVAIPMN